MSKPIADLAADNIRILAMSMVEKAKSGHPGGAMGGADFVNLLYSEFLNFDPDNMEWPFRDRFFLDPGHMSAMMYAVLALVGTYSMEDLKNFRQWQSPTPGHPELDVKRGVENTSGPLGQGLADGELLQEVHGNLSVKATGAVYAHGIRSIQYLWMILQALIH